MVSFDTVEFLLLADSMEITKVFPYRNNDLLYVNVLIDSLNSSAFTWYELERFKNTVIKSPYSVSQSTNSLSWGQPMC